MPGHDDPVFGQQGRALLTLFRWRPGVGAWLRLAALALAFVACGAIALPPQETSQDATRSLHSGTAVQAARTAAQSQADREAQPAPVEPEPGRPTPGPTRGVRSSIATQATADVLHPDAESNRGVLFRITAPALDGAPPQVGYLFGTIHFGTPAEQGVDYATLGQLLDAVAVFANEADVDTHWDPRLDGYRWLPEPASLDRLLDADAIAKAQELLPDVQASDLRRMRPWMVLALLEARGEQGGDDSADIRLQRIASGMGKQLVHLESLEDQLRALDCVPAGQQAQVLAERLHEPVFLKLDSAEAMAAYRARDLEAWLVDVDRMDGLSDGARQIERRSRLCLLEDRNARWIGAIKDLYRRQRALVAVGALHLAGPNGLIARLRGAGFKVEAVPMGAQ